MDVNQIVGVLSISRFLTLPTLLDTSGGRRRANEPIIDYIKSIMMTSFEYITQIEAKALKNVEVEKTRKRNKKQEGVEAARGKRMLRS